MLMKPKHPIYIISKGRWENPMTAKALHKMRQPHFVVIEPQEEENYRKHLPKSSEILVTPFSNLGQGSIPSRNFVWEDAISRGAEWHWIMDDNIEMFYRLNYNIKIPSRSPAIFRCVEDFVDRYENIGQSGMHYYMWVPRKVKVPPFYLNTRVYSCILNRNSMPHRWRGRYNEDTDLSLRILKDGWCTVLFNAFLAKKTTTMTMTGGNTDELYKQDEKFDGRLAMAESLVEQHPDVATISWKWGRYQHHVDYSKFKQQLKFKKGYKPPKGDNEYGMVFQDLIDGKWVTRKSLIAPRKLTKKEKEEEVKKANKEFKKKLKGKHADA